MQHMITCREHDMSLPYSCLTTHLMLLYDMNLTGESSITLGWNNFLEKITMKKINIFEVNGVWQFGRPRDEQEQEHKDIPYHKNMLQAIILNPKSPMIRRC